MSTSSVDQQPVPSSPSATLPIAGGWIARIVAALLLLEAGIGFLALILPANSQLRQNPLLTPGFYLFHRGIVFLNSLGVKESLAYAAAILALLAVSSGLASLSRRFFFDARYQTYLRQYEELKRRHQLADNDPNLSSVHSVLEDMRTGRLKNRNELLKVFAEAKRKLDEIGRDLAFLSLDVVGSTELKQGEEKAAVEHDFKEFGAWAERTLQASGAVKVAWTPDGAMAAFNTVDDAVEAGQRLLQELPAFNEQVRVMRRPFALRCGVNAGYVYFDSNAPLETLSDRVVDIAAHLQHAAPPNSLCVARPAIEPLRARTGFTATGRMVDGYEVFEWPSAAPTSTTPSAAAPSTGA